MRFIHSNSTPLDGTHIVHWPNGEKRVSGEYSAGTRQGAWTRWYVHGRCEEVATYRDGELHGPVTRWHPTGLLREEVSYLNGTLNGPWATWHPNGRLAVDCEWIAGCPHQCFIRFYPNGQRMISGTFVLGEPVGEWRVWTEAGHLIHRGLFVGKLIDRLPVEIVGSIDVSTVDARVA